MISSITELFYRGALNFCNYTCHYCPFSKKPPEASVLEADRLQLARFVDWVAAHSHVKRVFLLPYGEAMVHSYYWTALAQLTGLPQMQRVGIQTNNSFSSELFLHALQQQGGDTGKLALWCSFHPEQTTVEAFVRQCDALLSAGVTLTVGAVADYSHREAFVQLRKQLPAHTYMWFNAMDGMACSYEAHEVDFFTSIDPYFSLEQHKPTSSYTDCSAGKSSAFVLGNGTVLPCNRAGQPMGNLYTGKMRPGGCKARVCDCFLSYSRRNLPLLQRFSPLMFRTPRPVGASLFFFDVDGTLVEPGKSVAADVQESLTRLSQQGKLFFATALPMELAQKKCRAIWALFSGGVFLSGADVVVFDGGQRWQFALPSECAKNLELTEKSILSRRYNSLRLVVSAAIKLPPEGSELRYSTEGSRTVITSHYAGKMQGIRLLQRYYLAPDADTWLFENNPAILGQAMAEHCRIVKSSKELAKVLGEFCEDED